jgi:hypothetical protein
MTLKQLSRTHASFLREFNKAVIQRRANIKKFMAGQMAMRRKSKNPNRSNTPSAIKAKKGMHDLIYRSIMNKPSTKGCGRWVKDKRNGGWMRLGTNGSKTTRRRCSHL